MGIILVVSLALLCSSVYGIGTQVSYDAKTIILNGERRIILSGSIHYPRSTVEMWPQLIQKAKEGGLDAIETYIFWNSHEPHRREYDFSENLDIVRFFKTIQEAGLYAVMRIGPYVCAEWSYGGFPVWLHNIPGIELRTDNPIFKNEMQIFTTKIVNICKEAKLFAPQGGPIILAQIENEYGDVMKSYGEAGKSYVRWAAQMAQSQNIGVPWFMSQQNDYAPESVISTCNGFYCDSFTPINPRSPKMWTENWTGWFTKWGESSPSRSAEDVAYSVARFFQAGGVFNNYYMYHGGTNFGRTAGGPKITTSYGYDAPLDEYGNINQPKWGHLKKLHLVLKAAEKVLTNSTPSTKQFGNGVELTEYANNATGDKVCFLSNENEKENVTIQLSKDGTFFVPAWSVSILSGCKNEVYNTAKVTTQTSIMVKQPQKPEVELSWEWKFEDIEDTLRGNGTTTARELLEQKAATSDTSDYLWYMTSVDVNETSAGISKLQVNTTGDVVLHVYLNGVLIGSITDKPSSYFEQNVTLKCGKNVITLLSVTVGLVNYGPFFDKEPAGIARGPVKLINGNTTMDLSSYQWSYKVGLHGEVQQIYNDIKVQWVSGELPELTPMTWYKTTFKAPPGSEAVVVDMKGMGKGQAWVNGKSIGRYWPKYLAPTSGCNDTCDYRGKYNPEKCRRNCGEPTQRWYHVPRSFLRGDANTMILLEEIGGNPTQVSFQTVTAGTVCGIANSGEKLKLSCHGGKRISEIQFASFGYPEGACGSFKKGLCDAPNSMSIVQKACIGRTSCSIGVSGATFGATNSKDIIFTETLAVQAIC